MKLDGSVLQVNLINCYGEGQEGSADHNFNI